MLLCLGTLLLAVLGFLGSTEPRYVLKLFFIMQRGTVGILGCPLLPVLFRKAISHCICHSISLSKIWVIPNASCHMGKVILLGN